MRRHPSLFLLFLAALQALTFHRAFAPGPLADVDSVCHVAYLRYFAEEFLPRTGALFGYTPRFNSGAPFLLYNVPPGVTLAGFLLMKAGLSATWSIKALLMASYLAVAPLAFLLARAWESPRTEATRTCTPHFVAVATGLFSSDLFGLEFFFHNGMVNACVAVPLLLLFLLFFDKACRPFDVATREAGPPPFLTGRRAAGASAVVLAALILTHVLSAYFACVGSLAIVATGERSRVGRRALMASMTAAGGLTLSSFWLLPSLAFAPPREFVYNWLRAPQETVSAFLSGSQISSYLGAFSPSYRTLSHLGVLTLLPSAAGVVAAFRERNSGLRALVLFWALCFALSLGPTWTLGLGGLPAYSHLLWYRFTTPAILAWLMLAGVGAHRLCAATRLLGLTFRGLTVAATLAALVGLHGRSQKLGTAARFEPFERDYREVSAWLHEHGDHSARVFGEFLAFAEAEPVSPNYLRQALVVDTGLSEVAGWAYENSPPTARLIERGIFWWGAGLLADDAERLGLRYVVAGTPQTKRRFEHDARWQSVVMNRSFTVFEFTRAVALATASERFVETIGDEYVPGGGYRYAFRVNASPGTPHETSLTVRVGASSAWRAQVNGEDVAAGVDDDGFVTVLLPPGASTVTLTWSIEAGRRRGDWLSLAALGVLALVLAVGSRRRGGPSAAVEWCGRIALASCVLVALWADRRSDHADVHLGLAHGVASRDDGHVLALGTADESETARSVMLEPAAWSPALADARGAYRAPRLTAGSRATHAHLRLGPGARVLVDADPPGSPLRLALAVPGSGELACTLAAVAGTPAPIPPACVERGLWGFGPGRVLDLRIAADEPLTVRRLSVFDDVTYLQAESFANTSQDGGNDAILWPSSGDAIPQNALTVVGDVAKGKTMVLTLPSSLPAGRYEAWLLLDTAADLAMLLRADIWFDRGGVPLGAVNGMAIDQERARREAPHFEWQRLGEAVVAGGAPWHMTWARKAGGLGGYAEVDAVAVVRED